MLRCTTIMSLVKLFETQPLDRLPNASPLGMEPERIMVNEPGTTTCATYRWYLDGNRIEIESVFFIPMVVFRKDNHMNLGSDLI